MSRRYWDFDATQTIGLGSFEEYAEAFREHFDRAVRRRLRSAYPVAVSLSGGLDSSSIFCVAETLRRGSTGQCPRILGFSYTSLAGSPSDESAFLTEIERQYGVMISRLPIGSMGPLNGSRREVWHVEVPFLDEMWATTRAFHSTVQRHGARVLLTGHWADQLLFDQAYLVDRFYDFAWRELRTHLNEFPRWFTDCPGLDFRRRFIVDLVKYSLPGPLISLLRSLRLKPARPWYSRAFRKRARRGPLSTLPHGTKFPTAHARSLYEQARSSRQVMCMEWENKVASMHGLDATFPFLDRDLVSFLMRIPGEIQTYRGVPKALLREGLRGVVPDAIARRTWKADFTYLINGGMARDYEHLVDQLRSGAMAMIAGYVNQDLMSAELKHAKDRLGGASADTAWSLSDLVGLEFWLQVFFGENNNGEKKISMSPEEWLRATAQGGTR